jgi:hypothetical protein
MLGAGNAVFKTTATDSIPLGVVADVNVRGVTTAVIVVNTDDAYIDAAEAITAGEFVAASVTAGAVTGSAAILSTSFGQAIADSSGGQVKVRFITLDPTFTPGAPTTPYYVVTQASGDLDNDKLHPNSGAPNYNVTHQASDVSDFDTEVGNQTDVAANTAARHTQGTDAGLDTGGPNAVTAAQAKAGYTHSGVVTGNPHSIDAADVGAIASGGDTVKDTDVDWGTGASQVSADDVPDGATNAIISLTQETNFGTAYTHSQTVTGNPHSLDAADVGAIASGGDTVKDTDIDWGVAAGQVSADDIGDGATNAIVTLTQESNFESAYSHVSANGTSHSMVRYSKFDGTAAPTVNDDVDLGYVAGSFWTDTTNDKNYVCLDNTNGAAVWTETTQSGGAAGATLVDTFTNGSGSNLAANTAVLQKDGVADQFDDDWALGATNFLGVLAAAIDNAASGSVTIAGIVTIDGIYTSGFDEGDWLAFGASGVGHTSTRDDSCWGIITEVIDADSVKAVITHPTHTGGTSGGGAGGAPTDATYITQTPNANLSAEQALNALDDGLLKHVDGVVAKAVPGTDYGFVERDGTTANDFDTGAFTTDGTWRDLNLSAIVPAGARAVLLDLTIRDEVVGATVALRKNGSTSTNTFNLRVQVNGAYVGGMVIVGCDANRIVEYNAYNTTWLLVAMTVRGWWL